ncbi:MAG: DUF3311 domain-containing protein [Planctomycetes bacterium]|nr:DUF3311 domain-containing protein [Planctomycetota bacterium]
MTGRRIVAIAAVALFILHQDFWFWESTALVFGFLPIGLAYHALYSILAAGLWAAAVKFAWPDHIERFAEAGEPEGGESSGGSVRS